MAESDLDSRAVTGHAAAAAYLRTPLPRCAVLVDRHLHKNGGTTMRGILLENDFYDRWTFWGYGLSRMAAVASTIAATLNASCGRPESRAPLRIAIGWLPSSGSPFNEPSAAPARPSGRKSSSDRGPRCSPAFKF